MAKRKLVYIQGSTDRQRFADGKLSAPVTGFWHIKKPTAQFRSLCGMDFDSLSETEQKPSKQKDVCHFCTRINDGKHPVFDSLSESSKSSRKPEDVGTRARPVIYARRAEVVA